MEKLIEVEVTQVVNANGVEPQHEEYVVEMKLPPRYLSREKAEQVAAALNRTFAEFAE